MATEEVGEPIVTRRDRCQFDGTVFLLIVSAVVTFVNYWQIGWACFHFHGWYSVGFITGRVLLAFIISILGSIVFGMWIRRVNYYG